ncbi:MAG: hypothetical protein WC782_11590 [Methylococcaceae bacterium]
MKKLLILSATLFLANNAFAGTEHYLLRDEHHVHHLKITTLGDDIVISTDVDFEPNDNEAGAKPCSAEISGEGKKTGDNQLTLKKHAHSGASYCELSISLDNDSAKIEQSKDCDNFAAGICHFSSHDKALTKIK